MAQFPVRLPTRPLFPQELDTRLEQGDRRQGDVFYTPECEDCTACIPIRLNVRDFRPNKTHRRILRQGDRLLRVAAGPIHFDQARVDLYDKHLYGRGLAHGKANPSTQPDYERFVASSFIHSIEIRLYLDDALVGVAITDCGATALSAHYTYYDPTPPHLSLGTYAILQQMRLALKLGMQCLYLGLLVEQSVHMQYKARFHPNERRIQGRWTRFE